MDPVSRGNLRGVHYTETSAGPGPEIEYPSTPGHTPDDPVDQSLDRWNGLGDSLRYRLVLVIDRREQLLGRHPLQVVIPGGLFGCLFYCRHVVVDDELQLAWLSGLAVKSKYKHPLFFLQ